MELGCDLYQGFGLARPQTAQALESWLRVRQDRAAASSSDQPAQLSPVFGGAVDS